MTSTFKRTSSFYCQEAIKITISDALVELISFTITFLEQLLRGSEENQQNGNRFVENSDGNRHSPSSSSSSSFHLVLHIFYQYWCHLIEIRTHGIKMKCISLDLEGT